MFVSHMTYLFPREPTPTRALGLQQKKAFHHAECLILGIGNISIVVETKNLWSVIDGQAANVRHVSL